MDSRLVKTLVLANGMWYRIIPGSLVVGQETVVAILDGLESCHGSTIELEPEQVVGYISIPVSQ